MPTSTASSQRKIKSNTCPCNTRRYDRGLVGPIQVPYTLFSRIVEEMRAGVPMLFDEHRTVFQALGPTHAYQVFVCAHSAAAEAAILRGLVRLCVIFGEPLVSRDTSRLPQGQIKYRYEERSQYHHEIIKLGLIYFNREMCEAFWEYRTAVHEHCGQGRCHCREFFDNAI